jgi:selenocysteine-specific elongation factor
MYVIGTAGHVDHGKSTLVKALTGIDPDRWEEEQRREMTIDLGFAWLTLPSGRSVSVIDVPGHERFIKNMLAGVGGIDAALLIIAADESLMPQTREHLAILDLLGVSHGLVVITKAELVDEEWLELVREELGDQLAGTTFATLPRLAVSARTGQGLDALRAAIDTMLAQTPSRTGARGSPRLSIDRAFTIGGFGTVVTGTLLDGPLHLGQELVLLPGGLRARVRGIQSHKTKQEVALPGTRVAVNLSGVHHEAIRRGDVLALPGQARASDLLDVQVRLIRGAPRPLEQNDLVDLFVGAAEVPCRVTLLDRELLRPGETGWVQLRLEAPIVALRGDRCIVRQPSPSLTIGGGMIVDVQPRRHRRFRPEVIAGLDALAKGRPDDLLAQAIGAGPPREWAALQKAAGLDGQAALAALAELVAGGRAVVLGDAQHPQADTPVLSALAWQQLLAKMRAALAEHHRRFPLRAGMPREELRSRLGLGQRATGLLLELAERAGLVRANALIAALPEHAPRLTAQQHKLAETLLALLAKTPFSPPSRGEWAEARLDVDGELLAYLVEQGQLVSVGGDVFFTHAAYAELLAWVQAQIGASGALTVAELRDRFGTSRKYALALLEHLDERKVTRRVGDTRVRY